jgi:hypothetical protein
MLLAIAVGVGLCVILLFGIASEIGQIRTRYEHLTEDESRARSEANFQEQMAEFEEKKRRRP